MEREESPRPLAFNSLQYKAADGLALAHSEGVAVGGNIAVMFGKVARETVVPVAVADEVIKLALGGMQGSFQGTASGIADRAGRQTGKAVSVVGRIHRQVGVMKAAGIISRQQLRVDHAGIGIERHATRQAVVVDA